MNCRKIGSLIATSSVSDLPADIREQVNSHLRACSRCAKLARAQKLTKLDALLRAKADHKVKVNWRQYERRLFDRLMEEHRKRLEGKRRLAHLLRPAYAAAAALLIAITMFAAGRFSVNPRDDVQTTVARDVQPKMAEPSSRQSSMLVVKLHIENDSVKTAAADDEDAVILGGIVHDSLRMLP